jgi:hypothetical protein
MTCHHLNRAGPTGQFPVRPEAAERGGRGYKYTATLWPLLNLLPDALRQPQQTCMTLLCSSVSKSRTGGGRASEGPPWCSARSRRFGFGCRDLLPAGKASVGATCGVVSPSADRAWTGPRGYGNVRLESPGFSPGEGQKPAFTVLTLTFRAVLGSFRQIRRA